MLPEQFVIAAVVLSVAASAMYVVATIKGTVQPNRVSYFLWALAPLIAFAAQVQQGIGYPALLTLSIGLGPVCILTASFVKKKSVWKLTSLDYICGALSLVGLLLWYVTQKGDVAIAFSILADCLAAIPTIVKSYKAPQTESKTAYFLTGISGMVTLLAVKNWNFATFGYPLYTLLINFLIYGILHIRNRT